MTDATKLIDRLRTLSDVYRSAYPVTGAALIAAADLIEQQADRIAALEAACAEAIDYYPTDAAPPYMWGIREAMNDAAPVADSAMAKDAERLDWLDAKNARFKMGWRVTTAPAGNVSVSGVVQLGGTITSIRAAIDAAIAASAEKGD